MAQHDEELVHDMLVFNMLNDSSSSNLMHPAFLDTKPESLKIYKLDPNLIGPCNTGDGIWDMYLPNGPPIVLPPLRAVSIPMGFALSMPTRLVCSIPTFFLDEKVLVTEADPVTDNHEIWLRISNWSRDEIVLDPGCRLGYFRVLAYLDLPCYIIDPE